jgi:hypothetical protein
MFKVLLASILLLALYFFSFDRNLSTSDLGRHIEKLDFTDKNNNGLWDDVEQAMPPEAKDENGEIPLNIYVEYYKAFQQNLLQPEYALKIKAAPSKDRHKLDRRALALECMLTLSGGNLRLTQLQSAILSNSYRIRTWSKFNSYLSGGFYALYQNHNSGSPCDQL